MSLRVRLTLTLALAFSAGFGLLGWFAARAAGETVERSLRERVESTTRIIAENPSFVIHEAALRPREMRQLAAISGFELVVLGARDGVVAGSSLSAEAARTAAAATGAEVALDGVAYRVARARIGDAVLLLLSPAAPVEEAKQLARRPVLVGVGLGLVASILVGAVLAGSVTRPLRRLAMRVEEVREGRLAVEIPRSGGDEMAGLARAFEAMVEGLSGYRRELVRREKMATLGRFSAAVAHELRNPLSAMRMTVQMLRRGAGEDTAEDLDLLLAEIARLDHSIEELLFHAGSPRYRFDEVDLREPLREAARTVDPLARHLGVRVRVSEPGEGLPGRADAGRLRQALTNLAMNAIQAAPAETEVVLSVRVEGAEVVYEVEDSGPGVAEEVRDRAFEPFASGREGGTGLGLAVTRSIAEAHAGTVGFAREGGRTRFTLRLPREGGAWRESS